jgi:hypothetical protein
MRLGSLVCGLLISIIYLMDFLCLQRGFESRPCREILYIMVHAYNACAVLCLLYVNPLEKAPPPPPLHAIDNSILLLLLCTSSIF